MSHPVKPRVKPTTQTTTSPRSRALEPGMVVMLWQDVGTHTVPYGLAELLQKISEERVKGRVRGTWVVRSLDAVLLAASGGAAHTTETRIVDEEASPEILFALPKDQNGEASREMKDIREAVVCIAFGAGLLCTPAFWRWQGIEEIPLSLLRSIAVTIQDWAEQALGILDDFDSEVGDEEDLGPDLASVEALAYEMVTRIDNGETNAWELYSFARTLQQTARDMGAASATARPVV